MARQIGVDKADRRTSLMRDFTGLSAPTLLGWEPGKRLSVASLPVADMCRQAIGRNNHIRDHRVVAASLVVIFKFPSVRQHLRFDVVLLVVAVRQRAGLLGTS